MTNISKRLELLEGKIEPESDTPVKVEYARDYVPAATIIEAVMLAVELGIPIEDITRAKAEYKDVTKCFYIEDYRR